MPPSQPGGRASSSALADGEDGVAFSSGSSNNAEHTGSKPKRRLSRAASLNSQSRPDSNALNAGNSPGKPFLQPNGYVLHTHDHDPSSSSSHAAEAHKLVPAGDPTLWGLKLKYVSLVTLALQNASLSIIMHYSRISVAPSHAYSPATAVLLNELIKGSISALIALKRIDDDMTAHPPARHALSGGSAHSSSSSLFDKTEQAPASPVYTKPARSFLPSLAAIAHSIDPSSLSASLSSTGKAGLGAKQSPAGLPTNLSSSSLSLRSPLVRLIRKPWRSRLLRLRREIFSPDCWKLSIPALLYVVQNSLQYTAASNLEVAVFQVTYQMKILTTAGCSVAMLGRRLSTAKWMALLFLAFGVGIVQIQSTSSSKSSSGSSSSHVMNPMKGFSAVAVACLTSGLAGVYFEKTLKGSPADLWVRNVQLSLFSLVPAILPVLFAAPSSSRPVPVGLIAHLAEPFHDFNLAAWVTVFVQVFGGLVTAIVIKYSDNILKGFATSLSIVVSFLASVSFFGARVTPGFVAGTSMVLFATWSYNQPDAPASASSASSGVGAGGKSGRRGSAEKMKMPGSPVPVDAPILGDVARPRPSASRAPSLLNLSALLSTALSSNPSSSSSSSTYAPARSHPGSGAVTPQYGYHMSDSGHPTATFAPDHPAATTPGTGAVSGYYTPVDSLGLGGITPQRSSSPGFGGTVSPGGSRPPSRENKTHLLPKLHIAP